MKLTIPDSLKVGDKVGVIALSDHVTKADIEASAKIVESWGLTVKLGINIFRNKFNFAAGTAKQREHDLKEMLHDPEIKAIWLAGGGYSILEVMDLIDHQISSGLLKSHKWVIGYSDNSIFNHGLAALGVASIHGPNFGGFHLWDQHSQDWMKQLLMEGIEYDVDASHKWHCVHPGKTHGQLIISNLTCLTNTFGTRFDPLCVADTDVVLGIEECDTYESEIQRLLEVLMLHEQSFRIKGMILGNFTDLMETDYPTWSHKTNVLKIVRDTVSSKKNIPIAQLSEFGHPRRWMEKHGSYGRFLALPELVPVEFSTSEEASSLKSLISKVS